MIAILMDALIFFDNGTQTAMSDREVKKEKVRRRSKLGRKSGTVAGARAITCAISTYSGVHDSSAGAYSVGNDKYSYVQDNWVACNLAKLFWLVSHWHTERL
jgi:hypothetical protein